MSFIERLCSYKDANGVRCLVIKTLMVSFIERFSSYKDANGVQCVLYREVVFSWKGCEFIKTLCREVYSVVGPLVGM